MRYHVQNILVGGRRVSGSANGKTPEDALRRLVAVEARQRGIDVAASIATALSVKGYRVNTEAPEAEIKTQADQLIPEPKRDYQDWPAMMGEANELTALAKEAIKVAQSTGLVDRSDRYDDNQIRLALDNDERAQAWLYRVAGEDEDKMQAILDEVRRVLASREDAKAGRLAKKLSKTAPDASDPLAFLASKIKSAPDYNAAVHALMNRHEGDQINHVYVEGDPEDDARVQSAWSTVYQAAHGGGMGEFHDWSTWPRFSDVDPREHDALRRAFGNVPRVPERVTVYRGTPRAGAKIVPGNYTTLSRDMARGYAKGEFGAISKDTLPSRDLRAYQLDNGDATELIYWPDGSSAKGSLDKTEPPITFRQFWDKSRGVVETFLG